MSEIAQAIADRQSEIDRLQAEIKALTDVEQILGASAPAARSTSRRSSSPTKAAAAADSKSEAKPARKRREMSTAEKKAVSERMTAYWANGVRRPPRSRRGAPPPRRPAAWVSNAMLAGYHGGPPDPARRTGCRVVDSRATRSRPPCSRSTAWNSSSKAPRVSSSARRQREGAGAAVRPDAWGSTAGGFDDQNLAVYLVELAGAPGRRPRIVTFLALL